MFGKTITMSHGPFASRGRTVTTLNWRQQFLPKYLSPPAEICGVISQKFVTLELNLSAHKRDKNLRTFFNFTLVSNEIKISLPYFINSDTDCSQQNCYHILDRLNTLILNCGLNSVDFDRYEPRYTVHIPKPHFCTEWKYRCDKFPSTFLPLTFVRQIHPTGCAKPKNCHVRLKATENGIFSLERGEGCGNLVIFSSGLPPVLLSKS
jgi:hypothetical protein